MSQINFQQLVSDSSFQDINVKDGLLALLDNLLLDETITDAERNNLAIIRSRVVTTL